ncbi:hypothetical protein BU204_16190 [Actinophytocola xanthii]|uniref:Peptidase inhibitor family I36 protein n=2 Tax=Actinophytocola xanthii TaxID=1912961 RepID=A0A1Q8CPW1_9PSEU|nr:hypothetical protein BU204_16190 [Actinophytocola xanthii]
MVSTAAAAPGDATPDARHGVPALLTKQAASAAELRAQLDLQLELFPGGRQTASNEISYGGGQFVVSYAQPGEKQVRAADCPSGWFCFYDRTNYGYPRGRLSDVGVQNLSTWGWENRTESVHNNTSTYVEFLDNNEGFLFCMESRAVSSDVNPWRNQADMVNRGGQHAFC